VHIPFADLGHQLIKQASLDHASFQKGFHSRFGNGRDVVEIVLLFRLRLLDLWAFDHPSVAHEDHRPATKSLGHLVHLSSERFGVNGIPRKNLNASRQNPVGSVSRITENPGIRAYTCTNAESQLCHYSPVASFQ
jgi:hypothetical protein